MKQEIPRIRSSEQDKKSPTLARRIGQGALAIIIAAGGANIMTSCSDAASPEKEAAAHAHEVVPNATEIVICNGINIRDNPSVREYSSSGETNLIDTVDFGQLPEDFCLTFTIPDDKKVYEASDPTGHNGEFIGFESEFAQEILPGLDLSKGSGLLFMHTQGAAIKTGEITETDQPQS